jgi:signal transduction histidine kinase
VAEAHGGEIGAANQAGGGACFTVRLPLLPARPARSALAASSAR